MGLKVSQCKPSFGLNYCRSEVGGNAGEGPSQCWPSAVEFPPQAGLLGFESTVILKHFQTRMVQVGFLVLCVFKVIFILLELLLILIYMAVFY